MSTNFSVRMTGGEIMKEYGLAPKELGQLCYEEKLHAYTPMTIIPLLDEYKARKGPEWQPVEQVDDYRFAIFDYLNFRERYRFAYRPATQRDEGQVYTDEYGMLYRYDDDGNKYTYYAEDLNDFYESTWGRPYGYSYNHMDLSQKPKGANADECYERDLASMWFNKEEVQACLARKDNDAVGMDDELNTILPEDDIAIILAGWEKALLIEEAKNEKFEIPARRIRTYIQRHHEGISTHQLAKKLKSTNISKDLNTARKKDIPELLEKYPSLRDIRKVTKSP